MRNEYDVKSIRISSGCWIKPRARKAKFSPTENRRDIVTNPQNPRESYFTDTTYPAQIHFFVTNCHFDKKLKKLLLSDREDVVAFIELKSKKFYAVRKLASANIAKGKKQTRIFLTFHLCERA